MGRIAVTIAGLVGVGISVWLIIRFWDSGREEPDALPPNASRWERLLRTTGRAAGMVAGALVAGVLVLGLGGRLMMRLLGATSSDSAQGRFTDAEAIVGEVTLGGTLFFVLGVGMFGGLVGLAGFVSLRRWLATRSVFAGMTVAAMGAGLVARPSGLVDPNNPDFVILSPTWLALVFAFGLIVLFGLLLGVLIDRWGARWPTPGRSLIGIAGLLPLLPLVLGPVSIVVIAALIAFGALVAPAAATARDWSTLDGIGRVVLVVLAILGGAWTFAAGAEILTL